MLKCDTFLIYNYYQSTIYINNISCRDITEQKFTWLGSCGTPVCEGDKEELIKGGSSTNGQSVSGEEGVLLAGTSVFVLQPGEKRSK